LPQGNLRYLQISRRDTARKRKWRNIFKKLRGSMLRSSAAAGKGGRILAAKQVNPTRMELTRLKKKRITAIRGHKLLKDKRDELMRQYLDLVRENMEVRKKVEAGIRSANKNFVIAKAGMSEAALNTALMAPKQEVNLEAGEKNVMSVDIPTFQYKTRTADENDIYSYGFAFTSGDLDGAVKSLADVLPDMIRLAECEKACQLMAAEIEKTRRRVNALEHVIIPETEQSIKYITMKLDENERSTQIRLMKVKDMTLEFTIKDGRVETKPFDIKMGDYNLNLSGSTGLDQTIDYTGKIKLPASAGNISKLMTLDLKIGGSFTSPKVSVDTKSMASQAVEAVADEAISKLGQKLGLDSAATANKDSVKQKVTEKAAEKALDFLKKKLK
jgi:V/A-type H+-transporting ATPase subunit D